MDKIKQKRKVVIFDLDGTLLNVEPIFREIHELNIKGSNNRWKYFYENCNGGKVKPIKGMLDLYKSIRYSSKPLDSIILTARSEEYRQKTMFKMSYEGILCDKLLMRKKDDFRPAYEVKRDYLIELMKKYDVIAFFDDDIKNCKMAKELGIVALRIV